MGLLSVFKDIAGWVAGDGNEPGTPETRSLGYDPGQVASASAQLLNAEAPPNTQGELLFMGVAGVALIFLLRKR